MSTRTVVREDLSDVLKQIERAGTERLVSVVPCSSSESRFVVTTEDREPPLEKR